jgi:enhancing lycopene biosynthesis protein 2
VLVESARIARGKIKPLSTLQADSFSAVIFPGGYGAAKNLCNFATQGENLTVNSDVQRVIKEFHDAKKPIGMLCVSPVIVAKMIPGVSVTLGNEDKDIEGVIQKLGAKSVPLGVSEVAVDEENNVISSPAYMTNSPIHKVFDGIGKFVETVLSRAEPELEAKKDTKS